MKPFAESCAENQEPILAILRSAFADVRQVLEIGSGTGQHAVHFARHLPDLIWQTSDLEPNHPGIRLWLEEAALPNTLPPLALNVMRQPWPCSPVDGVFTANTLHIVSWPAVERLLQGAAQALLPGGVMCIYGPFNYEGAFTSPSNERFDAWLKARDPASGIRDAEAVCAQAARHGLRLEADHAMPVNNRTLVLRKQA
jgi:SAM-dependent methyltransferase